MGQRIDELDTRLEKYHDHHVSLLGARLVFAEALPEIRKKRLAAKRQTSYTKRRAQDKAKGTP